MPSIKCRAYFAANNDSQFGFYGAKGEPHRRIKNGEEFSYFYDEDSPPKIEKKGDMNLIGSWIEVLELPRRRRKKKEEPEVEVVEEIKEVAE